MPQEQASHVCTVLSRCDEQGRLVPDAASLVGVAPMSKHEAKDFEIARPHGAVDKACRRGAVGENTAQLLGITLRDCILRGPCNSARRDLRANARKEGGKRWGDADQRSRVHRQLFVVDEAHASLKWTS
jgi:hypothetical protein